VNLDGRERGKKLKKGPETGGHKKNPRKITEELFGRILRGCRIKGPIEKGGGGGKTHGSDTKIA